MRRAHWSKAHGRNRVLAVRLPPGGPARSKLTEPIPLARVPTGSEACVDAVVSSAARSRPEGRHRTGEQGRAIADACHDQRSRCSNRLDVAIHQLSSTDQSLRHHIGIAASALLAQSTDLLLLHDTTRRRDPDPESTITVCLDQYIVLRFVVRRAVPAAAARRWGGRRGRQREQQRGGHRHSAV